jgi:hypothetical protein
MIEMLCLRPVAFDEHNSTVIQTTVVLCMVLTSVWDPHVFGPP